MKKVIMAVGNKDLEKQIENLDGINICEQDDDIDFLTDLIDYEKYDAAIINMLLSREKCLKFAHKARKKGIKVICLADNKKSFKTEIAALVGEGVYAFVEFGEIYSILEYIKAYPSDYDFAELAELDEDKKDSPELKSKKSTVAFLGIMPRIGTTTQAFCLCSYLIRHGYRACYIECNTSGYIDSLGEYYDGVKTGSEGQKIYMGVEMFPKGFNLRKILDMDYDFFIYDFGCINTAQELNWIEKDIKILVAGTKPSELAAFQSAIKLIDDQNPAFIFSFSAESEHDEVRKMMGESAGKTYFADYTPDPFEDTLPEIYADILNLL